MATKNVYKGIFNLKMEVFMEYAYAYSPAQAKTVMVRRIAKKHGVLPVVVFGWLKEHPHCYEIRLETEFEEVENDD